MEDRAKHARWNVTVLKLTKSSHSLGTSGRKTVHIQCRRRRNILASTFHVTWLQMIGVHVSPITHRWTAVPTRPSFHFIFGDIFVTSDMSTVTPAGTFFHGQLWGFKRFSPRPAAETDSFTSYVGFSGSSVSDYHHHVGQISGSVGLTVGLGLSQLLKLMSLVLSWPISRLETGSNLDYVYQFYSFSEISEVFRKSWNHMNFRTFSIFLVRFRSVFSTFWGFFLFFFDFFWSFFDILLIIFYVYFWLFHFMYILTLFPTLMTMVTVRTV